MNNFDRIDNDCYNLDITFARYIYPRLVYFKYVYGDSVPHMYVCLTSDYLSAYHHIAEHDWQEDLSLMIFAFKTIAEGKDLEYTKDKSIVNKVQRGLRLFTDRYEYLWH